MSHLVAPYAAADGTKSCLMKILLVNFGGPRSLDEVEPFLIALLTDQDVVRTSFPAWIHRILFRRIARKRALRTSKEYEEMGGGSPIYSDTEAMAQKLSVRRQTSVLTFHRYLPATHAASLEQIRSVQEDLVVLPLFPQFCYATTGSVARFFSRHLPQATLKRLHWIRSYAEHPSFLRAYQQQLRTLMAETGLLEERVILLFSAHGIPVSFQGESYPAECEASVRGVLRAFPRALGRLSYQSRVGRGDWIKPYTEEVCRDVSSWGQGRQDLIVVPISFTSDHVETLIEIEKSYLPLVRGQGVRAYRCPAVNQSPDWIGALQELSLETQLFSTEALVRGF